MEQSIGIFGCHVMVVTRRHAMSNRICLTFFTFQPLLLVERHFFFFVQGNQLKIFEMPINAKYKTFKSNCSWICIHFLFSNFFVIFHPIEQFSLWNVVCQSVSHWIFIKWKLLLNDISSRKPNILLIWYLYVFIFIRWACSLYQLHDNLCYDIDVGKGHIILSASKVWFIREKKNYDEMWFGHVFIKYMSGISLFPTFIAPLSLTHLPSSAYIVAMPQRSGFSLYYFGSYLFKHSSSIPYTDNIYLHMQSLLCPIE